MCSLYHLAEYALRAGTSNPKQLVLALGKAQVSIGDLEITLKDEGESATRAAIYSAIVSMLKGSIKQLLESSLSQMVATKALSAAWAIRFVYFFFVQPLI